MGTGIAIVANRVAGLNVHVVDANEKSLDNSKKFIGKTIDWWLEKWCDKEIGKERLTNDDKHNIIKRMSFSTKIEDFKNSDIVIEVLPELN